MLVVDPCKRLTLSQVCQHAWMLSAGSEARRDPLQAEVSLQGDNAALHQAYNEQILTVMHSLNIDRNKTVEVRFCVHSYLCSVFFSALPFSRVQIHNSAYCSDQYE